jgi:hypothetical protein
MLEINQRYTTTHGQPIIKSKQSVYFYFKHNAIIQGDQKVSVQLTITAQSSGAQKLFDQSLYTPYILFIFNTATCFGRLRVSAVFSRNT